jgi:transmembrane sensor
VNTKRISDKDLAAMAPHEAASYWFVRHDTHNITTEDQLAFDVWLAASDTHRRAYEQTRSMWTGFEKSADEGELRALRVAALATAPAQTVWPRAAVVAAGVLIAVAGVVALIWQSSNYVRSLDASAHRQGTSGQYVTAHNQRSTVMLPDGTSVTMNLDTSFDIDFVAGQRLIHLIKGEAYFDVAKDRHRPFIVVVGSRHIQALGTQFDVRLDPNRLEVVLVEGRVSVDRDHPTLLDKNARQTARVELEPNQRLIAAVGQPDSITATNAAQATSWREGWIVFEDETVEQAIAELNRYSDRPLVAGDEAVKRLRLSGVFRIGQPDRFGAVIQELLPITAARGANGETLLMLKPAMRAHQP